MAFSLFERSPSSGLGNIRRSYGEPSRNIDWVLMVAVAVQTTIGAVIVYSATRPRLLNRGADPFYFLQRQIIFVIFAAAILAFIMLLDYGGQLRGNAGLLYVGTIILLVLVLVAGAATGGARLAFNLGPVSLQPSEFAKVTTLLLLAGFLADDDSDSVLYERFIQGLMLVGLPAVLITVEPDLGSASVLVACAMGVMLVAGARMRNIIFVTSLAIVSVTGAVVAGVVSNYQLRRITAFLIRTQTRHDCRQLCIKFDLLNEPSPTEDYLGRGISRVHSLTVRLFRCSPPTLSFLPSGSNLDYWGVSAY